MHSKIVTLLGENAITLSISTAFPDGFRPKLLALSTTSTGSGDLMDEQLDKDDNYDIQPFNIAKENLINIFSSVHHMVQL